MRAGNLAAGLQLLGVACLCLLLASIPSAKPVEQLEDHYVEEPEQRMNVLKRQQMLHFEHHEMPFPALGGGGGLGGADGVGGTGDQNVMYNGAPRTDLEKQFGMRMPPDARRPRGGLGLKPVTGAQMLYKRQLDTGEDYYSAIQAPDKYYSWPWLRDGKYYDSARYGVVDIFSDKPEYGKQMYERRPYDEYGDKAYNVDMSVADPCYDDDGVDCYRETFDAKTGYPLPLEPES